MDGLWSVSVYNAKGCYDQNPQATYTLDNCNAKKGVDGAIRIQFSGCDGKKVNGLPIVLGWN